MEPIVTKFGAHDYLEIPSSGDDFGSKSSKVKVTCLKLSGRVCL